jgi:hypothetical protein
VVRSPPCRVPVGYLNLSVCGRGRNTVAIRHPTEGLPTLPDARNFWGVYLSAAGGRSSGGGQSLGRPCDRRVAQSGAPGSLECPKSWKPRRTAPGTMSQKLENGEMAEVGNLQLSGHSATNPSEKWDSVPVCERCGAAPQVVAPTQQLGRRDRVKSGSQAGTRFATSVESPEVTAARWRAMLDRDDV